MKILSSLKNVGIEYVFAGKALGARPDDPDCYENGRVSFARLAARLESECLPTAGSRV